MGRAGSAYRRKQKAARKAPKVQKQPSRSLQDILQEKDKGGVFRSDHRPGVFIKPSPSERLIRAANLHFMGDKRRSLTILLDLIIDVVVDTTEEETVNA